VIRRTLLVTAGWLGAAVLAVIVGLGAVRVIGDGLTSGAGRPRTEAEVARALASHGVTAPAATASPAETPSTESPTAVPAGTATSAAPRSFHTRGGTVVAQCVGRRAEITVMAPLSGFAVHERDQGPRAEAEGEFRGTTDDHDRVRVRVTCTAGRPTLSERDR
jgi:hypothetical protein